MLPFIKGHAHNIVNAYKLKKQGSGNNQHLTQQCFTTLKLSAALVWLNECITEVNSLWIVCDIWIHWSKKKMETKDRKRENSVSHFTQVSTIKLYSASQQALIECCSHLFL